MLFEGGGVPAEKATTLSRSELVSSANTWQTVGAIFVVLAAIGAVIIGIQLAPTKTTGAFDQTKTDTGAGIAIGIGVFVASLVTILPYFMFSRVMRPRLLSSCHRDRGRPRAGQNLR